MKKIKMNLPRPNNEVQLKLFLNKIIEKLTLNYNSGMQYIDLNETIIILETIYNIIEQSKGLTSNNVK